MAFSDLWPQWLGGTSGLQGAQTAAGSPIWNVDNPVGTDTLSAATVAPAAGGTSTSDQLLSALKGPAGAAAGAGNVNKSQASQGGGVASRTGQPGGGAQALAQLVALLMRRDQGYLPAGGSAGQPITPKGTGGLLGL